MLQATVKDLDKNDQYLYHIGRFIWKLSELEFHLKCTISNAINLPDDFFLQILSHDFAMLCTIAQHVLSRGEDERRIAKLEKIIGKFRELNNHRVRIVHGWWRGGRDPPPLKWSDLRYVFDIKEDCNGKEAIQA
jgi:hypothetical protein